MFQLNTARIAQNPDPMQCYRDMIVAALNAKGLVPAAPPALSGFPGYVHEAFMAGAELPCLIYTGEEDLPFFAVGNTLMFTAYGPGTAA